MFSPKLADKLSKLLPKLEASRPTPDEEEQLRKARERRTQERQEAIGRMLVVS